MAATAGYKADISIVADATGTTFTGEATTANTARTMYQITATAKRYWSPSTAILVETSPDNASWTTLTSGYQLAYAGGVVIFAVARAPGTYIRVSGKYLTPAALGYSKEWTLTATLDTTEVTAFTAQSNGGTPLTQKQHIPTLPTASVSLSKWFIDGYFLPTIALPNMYFLLVLYTLYSTVNANARRFECLCVPTGDTVKCALTSAIEESLTFTATGAINTLQA